MGLGLPTANTAVLLQELGRCAKCGKCRSVCPVFQETQDEVMVTRGRLNLFEAVLQGNLSISSRLKEALDCCLMCWKCLDACPALVKTNELFLSAREWLNYQDGLPLGLRFAFRFVIPFRRLYDVFLKGLSLFQKIVSNKKVVVRHLPLVFSNPLLRMPEVSSRPLLTGQDISYRSKNGHPKVAIFTGCLINYVYPQIFNAITSLLKKTNISFITPHQQLCCGFPLLIYGDRAGAKRLALKNLKVFEKEKADIIITACATCGRMLKEIYPQLSHQPAVKHLSHKVMDVMEFIHKYLSLSLKKSARKTAYHQPCHFGWTRAGEITENLLKTISDYQETDPEAHCCGGGGMFAFKYPEIANQVGMTKINRYLNKIDLVTTGCPGCMMQLSFLLKEIAGSSIEVRHPVELLAENFMDIYHK